jgi:RNA polymerase sigma-70 factor (ECF subfamily)
MPGEESASHLSRISTQWDLLAKAHQGEGTVASRAQQELLRRYCGAIYHYLLGVLRDAHAAEDLSQEFALRFLRGAFAWADPERGRFRDYVKKALYHLLVDYRRRRQGEPRPLPDGGASLAAEDDVPDQADEEFVKHWRGELLGRTWETLAEEEAETGRLFHTVLRWRVEHPDEPAARLAELLSARQGKPFTESGIRVTLHRARERFADLLLDEVARSLQTPAPDRIEAELVALDLLAYCRPALDRRARPE